MLSIQGLYKGAFNNYMDQFWPNFDPLLPSSGQAWTFYIPPSLVYGDKRGKKAPPPLWNIQFNVILCLI